MQKQITPPVATIWHWTQIALRQPALIIGVAIKASRFEGYLTTSELADTSDNPISPAYWAGDGPTLGRVADEKTARAYLALIDGEGEWRLPAPQWCGYIRLWHHSSDGNPYRLEDLQVIYYTPTPHK